MKIRVFIIGLLAFLYVLPSYSQVLEWHIRDKYVNMKYLGNDLFKVQTSNGKWGIVNKYGELSIPTKYDNITPLVENRILLTDASGLYLKGIVNEEGQLLNDDFDDDVRLTNYPYFKEGMLAYGVVSGNQYLFGYLDLMGNESISPKFSWAAPFEQGKAVVQYKSKNFGLIGKTGRSVLNENRKLYFISTPINNEMLIAYGNKVALAKLESDGKLSNISELESNVTVNRNPADYKNISCPQNGHSYAFDDAMRLVSSSEGTNYNSPITVPSYGSSSVFTKVKVENGWDILYDGKTLLNSFLYDVSLVDKDYILVSEKSHSKGVLKLNMNGKLHILENNAPGEFYHNIPIKGYVSINAVGLNPESQLEIGIKNSLEGKEEKHLVPRGVKGTYQQAFFYFIPSTETGREVNLDLTINLYVDGILHQTENQTISAVHKPGFKITEPLAEKYSEPDGSVEISFDVLSLESAPSSSTTIIITGASAKSLQFNDAKSRKIVFREIVPKEKKRTFDYIVTIKEEGCPTYTRKLSKTVEHYDLK